MFQVVARNVAGNSPFSPRISASPTIALSRKITSVRSHMAHNLINGRSPLLRYSRRGIDSIAGQVEGPTDCWLGWDSECIIISFF